MWGCKLLKSCRLPPCTVPKYQGQPTRLSLGIRYQCSTTVIRSLSRKVLKMTARTADIPIVTQGRYFYRGEERVCDELVFVQQGEILTARQFLVKGVVYQDHERGLDPLSDHHLQRLKDDVVLFKELGINTIHICL